VCVCARVRTCVCVCVDARAAVCVCTCALARARRWARAFTPPPCTPPPHARRLPTRLQEFDAEGLGNLLWSIAGLQVLMPEREWLRQFVGACAAKLRSFQPSQLVQLVEGLAVLG